ncbi:MAG: hypothetical protein KDK04_06925 [Candidatus Competibacteraceae bacterium]|nr:hypothetical protein [Candidatus Competibacteraceae bacterium]
MDMPIPSSPPVATERFWQALSALTPWLNGAYVLNLVPDSSPYARLLASVLQSSGAREIRRPESTLAVSELNALIAQYHPVLAITDAACFERWAEATIPGQDEMFWLSID